MVDGHYNIRVAQGPLVEIAFVGERRAYKAYDDGLYSSLGAKIFPEWINPRNTSINCAQPY